MSSVKAIGASVPAGAGLATSQMNQAVNEASTFEAALKKAQSSNDDAGLKKVCEDFESIFVNMMMKSMRQANEIEGSDLTEKSKGREIFEGMLDDELSKKVASGGGMGLAKVMYNQLKKYQE